MGNIVYAISFSNFNVFIDKISKQMDVFGPARDKVTEYKKINSSSELFFDSLVEYTAKDLFFKPGELIMNFNKGNIMLPGFLKEKQKTKVLLGLRMCDLAAIRKQDIAFTQGFKDPYYIKRRENTLLFGYHQKQCGDNFCFCQSVDLKVNFDLMFYKRHDHYLVEAGSERGQEIIDNKNFSKFFDNSAYQLTNEDRKIENQLKLSSTEIEEIYGNHEWKNLSDQCISCGVCNSLCPTCYCFEFKDIHNQDGSSDKLREQSQCQLDCFTKVAGGAVFRPKKEDKFKHRIYHQLQYFKEKHGETLCVGCGRCIRHCPAKIDFVTGINNMKTDVKDAVSTVKKQEVQSK